MAFDREYAYEDYDANAWLDNWEEDEEEEEDLDYYDDEEEEECEEEMAEAEIRPTRPLKSCREIMEEYGMTIASFNREDAEYTFSLNLKGV
jgi:hypothetical protein